MNTDSSDVWMQKTPQIKSVLKRTLNLKEHLKKDKIEQGLTSVLKQE